MFDNSNIIYGLRIDWEIYEGVFCLQTIHQISVVFLGINKIQEGSDLCDHGSRALFSVCSIFKAKIL